MRGNEVTGGFEVFQQVTPNRLIHLASCLVLLKINQGSTHTSNRGLAR